MLSSVNKKQAEEALAEILPHLTAFVDALTDGKPDTPLHWRLIAEHPDIPVGAHGRKPVLNRLLPVNSALGWIIKHNLQGWAVFVTVNAYPQESLHGVKEYFRKDHVAFMRAAAADFDIDKGNAPTGWQHGMVAGQPGTPWDERLPLPSMQIESLGGPHLWWLYQRGADPSVPLGEGVNTALCRVLKSDPKICDAARVLRVPGFLHWKTGTGHRVRLVFAERERRYMAGELVTALVACGHDPAALAAHTTVLTRDANGWVETAELTDDEYKRALTEAARYIQNRPVTSKGARGSVLYKNVCQRLHDYGLRTEHALRLLRLWADTKCSTEPSDEYPFTDDALADRWNRAGASREKARGSIKEEWGGFGLLDIAREVAERGWAPPGGGSWNGGGQDGGAAPADGGGEGGAPPSSGPVGSASAAGPEDGPVIAPGSRGFVKVFVRARHRETLMGVGQIIARDSRVYEHDGKLSHIAHTSNGHVIDELTRNSIITYVTDFCQFYRKKQKQGEWVEEWCDVPPWLGGELLDQRTWSGVKRLKNLVTVPWVKRDGSVAEPGYDGTDLVYYVPPVAFDTLKVGSTQEDAVAARDFLLNIVADFPFQSEVQRAASLGAMLTPFCRRAMQGPAPMFLVDGNRPSIGKTNLMRVFTSMFGNAAATMPWSSADPNSRHNNMQRINTAFLTGQSILALDNLKGAFGDDVMETLLTSSVWSDRKLGGNTKFVADNLMTLYGTANNIQLNSDMWRRVITIRLVDYGQGRPEPRHVLDEYLPTVRKKMVEACLTILHAFCQAGRPRFARRLGSFENWSDWVASALMWLGLPDITQLVESEEDATEDSSNSVERTAVINAVSKLAAKLERHDEGISAQELAEALEVDRREAFAKEYEELTGVMTKRLRHSTDSITRADVAQLFRRHRDNSVNGRILLHGRGRGHRKSPTWRVIQLPAVEQGAVPVAGPGQVKQ